MYDPSTNLKTTWTPHSPKTNNMPVIGKMTAILISPTKMSRCQDILPMTDSPHLLLLPLHLPLLLHPNFDLPSPRAEISQTSSVSRRTEPPRNLPITTAIITTPATTPQKQSLHQYQPFVLTPSQTHIHHTRHPRSLRSPRSPRAKSPVPP